MANELQVIIKESGLEQNKAQYILDNFQDYFNVAAEWESKAKTIVVTSEKQEAEMKMARAGRLFLREKRIAVEKARKKLKEQSLREGKAIDGIANVLKALIIPIEEHLEKQEKYVQIKEKEKKEREQAELEKKLEAERIAKEKAEEEERKRMIEENKKLLKEAEEKEKKIKEQERKLKEAQAKAEAEKKAREEKASKEREEAQAKAEAEKVKREELEKQLKNQVECPFCHKKFQITKDGE